MSKFSYVARDGSGQTRSGVSNGATLSAVSEDLRSRGWMVVEVKVAKEKGEPLLARLSPRAWLGVRTVDIAIGMRQMALMLRSGLTLTTALRLASRQSKRRRMSRTWDEIRDRVEKGSPFADAVKEHRCVPQLIVQLLRVGEQTGNLEKVMVQGSDALDAARALRSSVLSALFYPALVILSTFAAAAYMVVSLIPKIETFLAQFGRGQLPKVTLLLIDISRFVRLYSLHAGVLFLASLFAVGLIRAWPRGRLVLDRWVLKIPIFGTLFRLNDTVLFTRSLGLMLRSGIILTDALQSAAQLLPNRFLGQKIALARQSIIEGSKLSEPLTGEGHFDEMLPQMIAIGEASGTLEEVLEEASIYYERELTTMIQRLGMLIEPAITIIVGSIVGFVYIATFLALYSAMRS